MSNFDVAHAHDTDATSAHAADAGGRGRQRRLRMADVQRIEPEEHDVVNARAMAGDLREELQRRLTELQGTLRESPPQDVQERARMQRRAERLQQDLLELGTVQNNPRGIESVAIIANHHQVHVPRQILRTGVDTQATTTATMDGESARVTRSNVTTRTQDSGERHTETQSTAVGLNDHGLGVTRTNSERHESPTGQNTTTTTSTGGTASVHDGTVSLGGERTNSSRIDHINGSRTEHSTRTSVGADINDHEANVSHGVRTTNTDTDAEGHRTSHSSTATATGGVIYGDHEHGVRAGASFARTTSHGPEDEPHSSSSTSGGGSATLTDHQVGGTANATHTEQRGAMSYTARGNGNLSLRVDVERAEEGDGYDVVSVLTYGAGGGGTVRAGRGTSLSVGGDVSASHSVTYRHRMSLADAQRYLASARQVGSGASRDDHPEFGMFARLRAAGDNDNVLRHQDVMSNSATASTLSNGSSMEVTDTLSGTGRLGGSVGTESTGVSLTASQTSTRTRTVRVRAIEVDGHRRVEIRLSFSDGSTRGLEGNARALGMAVEGGHEEGGEAGRVVTVRLDPASRGYDGDFQQVMAAHDLAAAQQVAEHFGAAMTMSSSTTTGGRIGVGLAGSDGVGTGLAGDREEREGESIALGAVDEHGHRSLDVTTTSSTRDRLNARVLGANLATTTDETSASNRVRNGEQQVDIEQTQTDSVPIAPQFLQRALHLVTTDLQQFQLNQHDVEELARRARSPEGWLNSLPGGLILEVQQPWNQLGTALRDPHPDRRWSQVDPEIANRIVRGQAITHFLRSVASPFGIRAIERVSRDLPGESLGRHVEWPSGIDGRGPVFHQLEERIEGARELYAGFHGADRADRIHHDAENIRTQLQTTLRVVHECTTFSTPLAKIETAGAVDAAISRINTIERQSLAHAEGAAPGAESSSTSTSTSTTETAAARAPSAEDQRIANEEVLRRVRHEVEMFKAEELRHWQAAQAQIRAASGWFANPNDCASAATGELEQIAGSYGVWVRSLREGYAALRALGRDGAELNRFRPNAEWSLQLFREAAACAGMSRGFIEARIPQVTDQWRHAVQL